ncbi:hypothetical protein [Cupriavidus necator]|uniref:hypothetical protein n=1 Tax=Cupriavidus necator TaxID=106590 RepID=UPI00339D7910
MEIVDRCIDVALHGVATTLNKRDANIFRLAAMILRPRFPIQSATLLAVCDKYFQLHRDDLIESAQVVRNGWITSPSRFRDSLEFRLRFLLK